MVVVLSSSTVDRGFEPGRVKPKTVIIVFAASPLNTQYKGERAKTGWFGIRIFCPSGATCLSANCCYKNPTMCVGPTKRNVILISSKWSFFSPWYTWCSWKCVPLALNTNKTDRHDIIEILLKVVLNTIKPSNRQFLVIWLDQLVYLPLSMNNFKTHLHVHKLINIILTLFITFHNFLKDHISGFYVLNPFFSNKYLQYNGPYFIWYRDLRPYDWHMTSTCVIFVLIYYIST
jgi:hypothetical protein